MGCTRPRDVLADKFAWLYAAAVVGCTVACVVSRSVRAWVRRNVLLPEKTA